LRRIGLRNSVHVNMTVTTLDCRLARLLEFRAPTPDLRLTAVRALRDAGIATGVTLSPILPEITDTPDNLEAVVAAAHEHGATHLFWNVLFLKPSAQAAFFPFLERHFPHLATRYTVRFSRSAFLSRAYKDRIAGLMDALKQRYGFPGQAPFEMPAPVHEAAADAEQLVLFPADHRAAAPTRSLPCVGSPPRAIQR